ncbi:uncharacterized protein LOC110442611 [Mizuhopecten yessoensis]|uniref:Uncharacterized protein n=1 Tax=Mizuhopecten yessoensis TaxID=6573 RepID=A0A210PGU6_MIZYE|nr:uncharacterized protein LOC110442611 [Mizuhopecten yessoensis]OWF35701.1 hypothetical protein KP79_PYT03307 [Mizuhopecten yessoensis]
MRTSSIHWTYVQHYLWALVSLIIIPLARTGDSTHSFTVNGGNCGSFISFMTKTMDIHWKGAALEDDCSVYIAINSITPYTVNNTLCARAEAWDVTDKHFTLSFGSGFGYTRRTYFKANETKNNVTYCARENSGLRLRFFTYRKSKSHVHLKITQTYIPDDSRGDPLPTAVYRLLGGAGAIIMVGLLASVILKRRRRARQGYIGRGGVVLRRTDEAGNRDEAMVALYRPAQNNPCTFTTTSTSNNGINGYNGPAAQSFTEYPSSQPTKPPEYSEIQGNQNGFPQYPDSAPPCYEDVAGGRSENTKI